MEILSHKNKRKGKATRAGNVAYWISPCLACVRLSAPLIAPQITKTKKKCQVQWLTPIIPTTWEAEIRGLRFEGKKVRKTLPQKNKLDMVVHFCNPS
jgi:hypothetical protein